MPDPSPALLTIVGEALELSDPAGRAAYLDRACGTDAALRAWAEKLLAAHALAGRFLELDAGTPEATSPGPMGTTGMFAPDPDRPVEAATAGHGSGVVAGAFGDVPPANGNLATTRGTVIAGRYKLLEEVGEGGMGTVWVARQTEPIHRVVAVKLIKAGMDSRAVLARFEAERQALALMDHPNIAKVLDAGATGDGRPFFVMELVKGVPITKFCDDRRLTPRQRLELFVAVCQAIQHAHQKGIIHRDIKPSNVLVALYDDRPVPKVIDFGVAKATGQQLTEKTLATGLGAVVGTPEYMSPEQASFNNLDIDTRSDVYALGVLLYELLAGSPPFSKKELERAGLLEMLRLVREVEPPKPSTKLSTAEALPAISANRGTEPAALTRSLRGELDWIVMTALEKDRSRRYDSANGFAADVLRYLAGEPVQAVPPSAGYRLRKFVRRNRAALLAGAAFAALLVAGSVVSAVLAIRADRNADRAAANEEAANTNAAAAAANEQRAAENEAKAKKETERVRGMLYAANFGRIQDALRDRRIGRVRELLAATSPRPGEPDLRGFEWFYIDRLVNDHRDLTEPHGAFGPDRRWVVKAHPVGPVVRPANTVDVEFQIKDVITGDVVFSVTKNLESGFGGIWPVPASGLVACAARRVVTFYDPAAKTEKGSLTLAGDVGDKLKFDAGGTRMAVESWVPAGPGMAAQQPDALKPQVEVWDLAKKERLQVLSGPDGWEPRGMALAPAGDRIAVVFGPTEGPNRPKIDQTPGEGTGGFQRVAVWDVGGTKPRFELSSGRAELTDRAFSPDGRTLVVLRGKSVTLYDAETGRPRRTFGEGDAWVRCAAVSPEGRTLAVGDDSAVVTLFDVASGQLVDQLLGEGGILDNKGGILDVEFRGDGRLVAHSGTGKEWDLSRWRRPFSPQPGHRIVTDPTGRFVLTGRAPDAQVGPTGESVREVVLWDTASGPPREVFRRPVAIPGSPHAPAVFGAKISPDGRRVLVMLRDNPPRVEGRSVLDVGGLLVNPLEGLGGYARAAEFWTHSLPRPIRTVAVAWDVPTGELLLNLPRAPDPITTAFSTDGRFLRAASWWATPTPGEPRLPSRVVWDFAARPPRQVLLDALPGIAPSRVIALRSYTGVFSADGRYLTGVIQVGPPASGKHEIVAQWPPPPEAAGPPPEILLARWELECGKVVFARPIPDLMAGDQAFRFVFNRDGTRLAATPNPVQLVHNPSYRPEPRLWGVRPDGELVRHPLEWGPPTQPAGKENRGAVFEVGFLPDGDRLISTGGDEVRLWDLSAGGPPFVAGGLPGRVSRVKTAAVSPDGRRLVMVTDAGRRGGYSVWSELRVWDLTSGQELLMAPFAFPLAQLWGYLNDPGKWPAFDGKRLVLLGGGPRGAEIGVLDGSPREPTR